MMTQVSLTFYVLWENSQKQTRENKLSQIFILHGKYRV